MARLGLGPRDAGQRPWSWGRLPLLWALTIRAQEPPSCHGHEKSMFSLEFSAARGFQKQTHGSVWLQRLKKKMHARARFIYFSREISFASQCWTSPYRRKPLKNRLCPFTCLQDSRQNDSHPEMRGVVF